MTTLTEGFEGATPAMRVWKGNNTPAPVLNRESIGAGAHPAAIHSGVASLRASFASVCWRGGWTTTIAVPVGTLVKVSMWARAWASESPNTFPLNRNADVRTDGGIIVDPTGGDDPDLSSNVKSWVGLADGWKQIFCQAVATQPRVTIFVGVDMGDTRNGNAM